MAAREPITARQRSILVSIVANYIETGEPIGSETIARLASDGGGVSSATIRNEMAALTAGGFLEQPHTSAGRVPTPQGFRLYVDDLSGAGRPGTTRLSASSRREIDSRLAGSEGTDALLERTSHLLATLTSGVGVAIVSGGESELLEHVHFSRLAPNRVLAVVVTRSGMVRDRVLSMRRDFSTRELEAAAALLNESFRGWSVERVRAEIAQRVERERSEYQHLFQSVEQLWTGAVPDTQQQTVFVGGIGNLVQRSSFDAGRARLREVLAALEAKQRIFELLSVYIDTRQESVRVVFDLEEQAPEMAGLVLIAAPARVAGELRGTVGVIGTTRMDYEMTMDAVSYIAGAFQRMLYPTA